MKHCSQYWKTRSLVLFLIILFIFQITQAFSTPAQSARGLRRGPAGAATSDRSSSCLKAFVNLRSEVTDPALHNIRLSCGEIESRAEREKVPESIRKYCSNIDRQNDRPFMCGLGSQEVSEFAGFAPSSIAAASGRGLNRSTGNVVLPTGARGVY